MKRIIALIAAMIIASTAGAQDVGTPEGRVLVTVSGLVDKNNTAPLIADSTNVSGFLGLEYDKAVAFDDAMLDGMAQYEIRANLLDTGKEMIYSGPRLSEILSMVGARGSMIRPLALDGYAAEIDMTFIEAHQPILATHADGKPLEVGRLGPTMIVFPVTEDAELKGQFGPKQVFALFHIGVEAEE